MATAFEANAFTNAFMRGFSFVDSINRRKKRERLLEAELDRRRTRQEKFDEIAFETAEFQESERERLATERERRSQATALLADPNTPFEALEEFSDIPEIASFLRTERLDQQRRDDLETIARGDTPGGLPGAVVTGETPTITGDEAVDAQLRGPVAAMQIPKDELAIQPDLTERDLNRIADDPEQGPEVAMQLRDEQREREAARNERDRVAVQSGFATGFGGPVSVPADTEEEIENRRKRSQKKLITQEWEAFNKIDDVSGDELRKLDSNLLTAKYFEDRSNIDDPEVIHDADRRMRPHITSTIETQQSIIVNPDASPQDLRNARRKLGEAYGLANEIGVTYKPLAAAGVSPGGLPTDGRNRALTDAVIDSSVDGPGMALPPSANQSRADRTVVSRPQGARVSERFSQAAYRLYKNSEISLAQYQHAIRHGKLPGVPASFEQTDPGKDTWMIFTDADGRVHRQLIVPARDIDDEALSRTGRNLLNDDGLDHLIRLSQAYNTPDDSTRGMKFVNSFINAIAQQEQAITRLGYDMSNVNDVGSFFERWVGLHGVRDAYNDEWFGNGQINPDFATDYGTMDQALVNPNVGSELIERESLRIPGTTLFGLGGQEPGAPAPLKPRSPLVYDAIRLRHPEFAEASDEEIEQAIRAQEQQAGRR